MAILRLVMKLSVCVFVWNIGNVVYEAQGKGMTGHHYTPRAENGMIFYY